MTSSEPGPRAPGGSVARRAATATAAGAGVLLLLLTAWRAREVLLLLFAGVLLAVLLSALTDALGRFVPLARGWRYALVLALAAAILAGSIGLAAPSVGRQVDELTQKLPESIERLGQRFEEYRWARWLMDRTPDVDEVVEPGPEVLTQASGIVFGTFGALGAVVVVLFVGLYLAARPALYRDGLVRLVPPARRARAREVLDELGATLRGWLLGQMVSMLIVGVLTTVGLLALGVPLALTLGLLAALLEFIPNFGPLLSAVPPVLLALLESPRQALWVVLLYVGIQSRSPTSSPRSCSTAPFRCRRCSSSRRSSSWACSSGSWASRSPRRSPRSAWCW